MSRFYFEVSFVLTHHTGMKMKKYEEIFWDFLGPKKVWCNLYMLQKISFDFASENGSISIAYRRTSVCRKVFKPHDLPTYMIGPMYRFVSCLARLEGWKPRMEVNIRQENYDIHMEIQGTKGMGCWPDGTSARFAQRSVVDSKQAGQLRSHDHFRSSPQGVGRKIKVIPR